MTAVGRTETDSKVGRPRDEAVSTALHLAALELLAEVGFERMSMEAVAHRAGTSKATVYRRWPGKGELVADALQCHGPEGFDPPDTGSLRSDLMAVLHHMRGAMQSNGAARIAGIIGAARTQPILADAMRADLDGHRQRIGSTVVSRAIARGELPPGADPELFLEVVPPMMLARLLLTDRPLDDAFLDHVVDDVAIPVLTHQA